MKRYAIILMGIFVLMSQLTAQQYTEYELKSAYLFNFAKFVEYPEKTFSSSRDPFIIGVYGNDAFLEVLQTIIKGRTVFNRPVIAISVSMPEEMINCQIIYFSRITITQAILYLEYIGNKPILTVADNVENFCEKGGMINFTPQYSHKRFEINPNAAQRANIVISSKLLSLAKIVNDAEVKF
ncbi:MAG: YfiR family protein [Bacteroidales bacterium]|nr:YfiR family protein [Bacteroidales bacterium]